MSRDELAAWGYRLNQLTRWQASRDEMEAQALSWGFEPLDAEVMAELAEALQAEFRDREPGNLTYRPWNWNDRISNSGDHQ